MIRHLLPIACCLLVTIASAAEKQFRAGAFAIDVTPLELPVIVNGGMTERVVDKVEDRLHARCLVLDDGTTQLAIVIVDSCMMPRDLLDDAKAQASAATKIPASNILIAATHTHSAPAVMGCLGSDADEKYSKFLPVQIAKGIQQAHANLQPARIGWAVGRDAKNVASRRWLMQPGIAPTNAYGGKVNDRVMMHPGPANKNAIAATGIIDADVPVVVVQTKAGAPLAVLTNYSMHYVGAPNLSADYFAVVCDQMRAQLKVADDSPFVAMHSNGTSGDQWLMDYTQPRRQFDRFQVGADVAGAAMEALQRIQYFDWVPLVIAERELELAIRQPNAEELAEATKLYETFKDRKPKTLPEVYAREAVLMSQLPAKRQIKLQALRLGELGIAAIPNEVFSSTGLQIKIESPTPTTFTIELANGAEGYIPPPKQHKLGGYETWRARSSCLEVTAEPKIRAAVLELLNQVNDARADESAVLASGIRQLPDPSLANVPPITEREALPPRLPKTRRPVVESDDSKQQHVQSAAVLTADRPRSPLSPEYAQKAFRIREGYQIELVAAEPLIVDPVAFDWGYDGRLWVVEMHDYPNGIGAAGPNDKGPPGGRVKVLKDTDGDGRYDQVTTFADKLSFPNGIMVMPDGGVLVTSAPQIVRLQDTNGDGKSDQQEILFSGFAEGNQQLRVNGLKWGLDGWIYCANGGVGRGDPKARIKVERTGELIDVGARDFRFSLDFKQLVPELGMSQFGRNRDDYGNWFGCNNNTPLYHIVHDDAALRRNPHLVPHATTVFVPQIAKPGPVYAISEKGRFWHDSEVGRFTSANSAMIYRDNLLGDECYGNFFVSEPVHNLVHREVMTRDGVTFTSHRPPDEEKREFLASTDTWFRPNMIRTGPDGALYISDMYREIIEHPGWIQPEKKADLTFRNGEDRGRIWRVTKVGVPPRQVPRIDDLRTVALVKLLDSPSGELRDLVQRWLVVKRPQHTAAAIQKRWSDAHSPASQVQMLCTLAAIDNLPPELVIAAIGSDDRETRSAGIRVSQRLPPSAELLAALTTAASDQNASVRFQVATALYRFPADQTHQLITVLLNDKDPFVSEAALTSVSDAYFAASGNAELSEKLIPTAVGMGKLDLVVGSVANQVKSLRKRLNVDQVPTRDFVKLARTLEQTSRLGVSRQTLREQLGKETTSDLDKNILSTARSLAIKKTAALATRVEAMQLVGYSNDRPQDLASIREALAPQSPAELQQAAIRQLLVINEPTAPEILLSRWSETLPQSRAIILDALLSREPWTIAFMAKLESGDIRPGDLDASRRQRLLEHPNAKLKARAAQLLATSGSADRKEVLAQWTKVLDMPGDAVRGKAEFTKRCATCHKWQGEGNTVGPDLNTLTDRSPKTLLTAVLDPNLSVEPKYQAYSITTTGGQVLSGMLLEETATTLTLADAGGKQVQVPRAEIEELRSTGRSLMPEGLDRDVTPQALADIFTLLSQPKDE